MAFERFTVRRESSGVFLNCKAPQVLSESHTIIEDCRGLLQFHCNSPTTPQQVFVPSDQHFHATKEEYCGSSWPKMTGPASTRPPLPLPPRFYSPQVVNMPSQVPNQTNKPVEVPQGRTKPINSTEAAKIFGGFVITEYPTQKQYHWV
ncbi:hypothetical protein M0R45_021023 [Rubus argutus]|uniref:Uncharacterized protein n=1 Tax=Rubus argutus TaxID=59490 RepID=A0AAW1XBZ8_RUBAR